jgi:hypothetical protein
MRYAIHGFCEVTTLALVHKEGFTQIWLQVIVEFFFKIEFYFATCWNILSKYGDFKKNCSQTFVTFDTYLSQKYFASMSCTFMSVPIIIVVVTH